MDLYLITNRKLVADGHFLSVIEQAIAGGIDAIILREKDLPGDILLNIAVKIKKIIAGQPARLIINNDLEVAKAVQADGYHTNFDKFMEQPSVFDGNNGVSVHNLDEAMQAEKNGASYLLASHIFATDCKKGVKPKGLQLIKDIKDNVNIPVIALGGISPKNSDQVLAAGADGIAVMSYIMQSSNPFEATKKFKK
ncbi:MAG: thiamine phosphate synthase [Syntrophomonas sp.]